MYKNKPLSEFNSLKSESSDYENELLLYDYLLMSLLTF